MLIVSIDPGGTTGVAIKNDIGWIFDQLGPHDHHRSLLNLLKDSEPDVVVCEDFIYQRRNKVNLKPVEYIGIVKYYVSMSYCKLEMQSPSLRGFWTDARLKQLKLYNVAMRHANDATRHLLYYLTRNGDNTYLENLARKD